VETTEENTTRDLFVSGLITLSVAPGVLVLGIVLALTADSAIFAIMLGVSTLIGFVGAGLIAASYAVKVYEKN
jgi:hypothetical protein